MLIFLYLDDYTGKYTGAYTKPESFYGETPTHITEAIKGYHEKRCTK